MSSSTKTLTKIIKKLLSDPRVVGAVAQVLTEILSENSNITENLVPNQPAQTTPQKQVNWSEKSDATLRAAYAYRKKRNIAIEPEFNTELAARFPGYDATQQIFTGKVVRTQPIQKPTIPKEINWSEKSDATLRAAYAYRKKRNITIEPEFNTELAARFPGYDATQQIFTGKKAPKKKVRVINWAEKSDDILRKAHKQRAKTSDGIDDELNAELARRFPTEYDPSLRTFVKQKKFHDFTTKTTQKSTPAPVVHRPVQPAPTAPAPATVATKKTVEQPAQLTVTTKLVKQSLDTAFYDVYVNGKKILRNHMNTELKLFADGTILGVYGTVTNDKTLPQRPLWVLYETNLVQKRFPGQDKITKHAPYAKYVYAAPMGVSITLSTGRMTLLLETEKLKRSAGLKRFEIQR